MIFIILMCAVVMFGDRSNASGWEAFRLSDEEPAEASSFDLACLTVAKHYSLTQRESEIFALLAKGRN